MEINVEYFKTRGKWYMSEHVQISDEWVNKYKESITKDDYSSEEKFTYNFRNWLAEEVKHDEFIAFVVIPVDSLLEEMLGWPMMVLPG
jgi:hypothetical protein